MTVGGMGFIPERLLMMMMMIMKYKIYSQVRVLYYSEKRHSPGLRHQDSLGQILTGKPPPGSKSIVNIPVLLILTY